MTTDRDTKLRAVAARFLGWEPGKMCDWYHCVLPTSTFAGRMHEDHEIPPPDPRDPAVRVALEKAMLGESIVIHLAGKGQCWVELRDSQGRLRLGFSGFYNDSADALLDAAYQLVRGEEG